MNGIELIEYPKPWLLFKLAMALSLGYMAFAFSRKWRSWGRGIPDPAVEPGSCKRPVRIWLAEVLLHRQLYALSFSRWLVHGLIFYGFLGLALLPLVAFLLRTAGYFPVTSTVPRLFIHSEGYLVMKLWGDTFGLMLLLGLVASGIRRFLVRPARLITNAADSLLLALLLLIVLSGFLLEGLRLAALPSGAAAFSYVGRLFSPAAWFFPEHLQPWLTACWSFHFLLVAALFAYLPHSKLLHSILAPVIIGMNATAEHGREDVYWPEMKKYRPTGSRKA